MPLWKARTSRNADEAIGGAVVVFSGSLRSPQEADALVVDLGFRGGEITMYAADTELGRWPSTAVEIRRFGKTSFEFTAEGDRLIFTPDDPATFGDRLIVAGEDAETEERKRRRSKKQSEEGEQKSVWDHDSVGNRRTAGSEAAEEPAKARVKKRSRRHRKAVEQPGGSEHDDLETTSGAPPVIPEPDEITTDMDRQPTDVPTFDDRSEPETPASDSQSADLKERINAVWIRAIDLARKYDTFGLDRVPIDTSLRGQEHEHTWDHRVAATSGLGQHICTICGAIRR